MKKNRSLDIAGVRYGNTVVFENTAPFTVVPGSSKVDNLNVNYLEGHDASYFVSMDVFSAHTHDGIYTRTTDLVNDYARLAIQNIFTIGQIISKTGGDVALDIRGDAGYTRGLNFKTGLLDRWNLYTSATPESGSNAGSDFFISRYGDNGVYIDDPLSIARDTGKVNATVGLQENGTDLSSKYLGIGATSANSLLLEGHPASYFTGGGTGGGNVVPYELIEDISAPALVNFVDSGGTTKIQKTDSVSLKKADGFIIDSGVIGESVDVHLDGVITGMAGLTAEDTYFLYTDGTITNNTQLLNNGNILQYIGKALSETSIEFNPNEPIIII